MGGMASHPLGSKASSLAAAAAAVGAATQQLLLAASGHLQALLLLLLLEAWTTQLCLAQQGGPLQSCASVYTHQGPETPVASEA